MQAFQKDLDRFEKLNAQVLGVSTDSLATHEEFSREQGLDFPLIADARGEVQKLYAPGRVTFIVDKSGTVRFVHKGTVDDETLLEELSEL